MKKGYENENEKKHVRKYMKTFFNQILKPLWSQEMLHSVVFKFIILTEWKYL